MKVLAKALRRQHLFAASCLSSLAALVFLTLFYCYLRTGMKLQALAALLQTDRTFVSVLLLIGAFFALELAMCIYLCKATAAIKGHVQALQGYGEGLSPQRLQQFERDLEHAGRPGMVRAGSLGVCGDGYYGLLRLRYPVLVLWIDVAWVYSKGRSLYVYDQSGTLYRMGSQPPAVLAQVMEAVKSHSPGAILPWTKEREALARRDFAAFLGQ